MAFGRIYKKCPLFTIVLLKEDNVRWRLLFPSICHCLVERGQWQMVATFPPRPCAPPHTGSRNPLILKEISFKNRYFCPSRPLPASPGNQNRCFLKGFCLKSDTCAHPGRSWQVFFGRCPQRGIVYLGSSTKVCNGSGERCIPW